MNIKALFLTAALALPIALPVAAHPPGERMANRMIEKLELDDARAEQVRQIQQDFQDKARPLHERMRTEMKALHEQRQEQLKQVLTEEEMAKLEEMKTRRHKEFAKDRSHTKERHEHKH